MSTAGQAASRFEPPAAGGRDERESRLLAQIEVLQERLQEAEETLRAIRYGEADALVVTEAEGEKVYTLKSADRPYRLMIEGMKQGAVTLTPDGIILYCNRCFADLLRAPLQKVTGTFAHRFLPPEDLGAFQAMLEAGLQGSSQGEMTLRAEDGTLVPVYLALSVLDLDTAREICVVVTDLTEQQRQRASEERLERAAAAAEAASQAKDRFLATLSHELRTPLTPVLALTSKLERDPDLPGDARLDLMRIRRNVELEARLIDDILDLTRIGKGKLELHRAATDVREVVEHAIQICCEPAAAAGRLRVVRDFAVHDHRAWADPVRLTQVFWNLLSNAIKFMPQGGTVAVRSRVEDGRLAVEVTDTGIGIEPEALGQIFGAFDQGSSEIPRRFGGLGLGLAISRAIVERHGGDLGVRSPGKDRGATFTVRLPLGELPAPEAAAPVRDAETGSTAAPASLSILLVEDHVDTAEAMADLLRSLGHRVTMAVTLADGLAAAARAQHGEADGIDLVVSDLGLPDGSGLELMRELRQRHGLPGIALSGYGMPEDVRESRKAGFAEHLTKPIDLQALQAAILRTAGADARTNG